MTLEDDLASIEAQVLGIRRVSGFLAAVEAIRRLLETHPDEVRRRILSTTLPNLGADLAAAVMQAFDTGALSAAGDRGRGKLVVPTASSALVASARTAQSDLSALVSKARKLATAGAEPALALAPLLGAATSAKRTVTTLVSRAGNAGVIETATRARRTVVWVAETNACVHCLAYSGRTVMAGKAFPAGLSYLESNPYDAPGKHPPLHPNCRCTLEVLNEPSYATALRREADRSVLRGFSLESESMRVRIEAADRLLASDVSAPKSVISFARKAVKAGKFETRGQAA